MELRVFNDSAPSGVLTVPPIPIRRRMFGPLTLMRRWRTAAFGASIYVFSLFLLYENFSASVECVRAGVDIPRRRLPLFRRSGGLFACGNRLPGAADCGRQLVRIRQHGNSIFAWLGGAVLAGVFAGTGSWSWVIPAVPTLVAAVVLLWIIGNRMSLREEVARARAHNAAFAGLTPLLRQFPVLAEGPELNPLELAVTCKTFDKALEQLNQWKGITLDVEQWQLSATRYQLYAASWQLAAVQYRHTPAFAGYSRDAQANLLQRMLDRRIWGFWFWENLWGNFDPNPDPIRRDNIMVSGYVAEIVGIFETLTGDRRLRSTGGTHLSMEQQERASHTITRGSSTP